MGGLNDRTRRAAAHAPLCVCWGGGGNRGLDSIRFDSIRPTQRSPPTHSHCAVKVLRGRKGEGSSSGGGGLPWRRSRTVRGFCGVGSLCTAYHRSTDSHTGPNRSPSLSIQSNPTPTPTTRRPVPRPVPLQRLGRPRRPRRRGRAGADGGGSAGADRADRERVGRGGGGGRGGAFCWCSCCENVCVRARVPLSTPLAHAFD